MVSLRNDFDDVGFRNKSESSNDCLSLIVLLPQASYSRDKLVHRFSHTSR